VKKSISLILTLALILGLLGSFLCLPVSAATTMKKGFADLRTETDFLATPVAVNNGTASWDAAEQAMKLTPSAVGMNVTFGSGNNAERVAPSTHPYIAVKVKMGNPSFKVGSVSVHSVSTNTWPNIAVKDQQTVTDDWRLLIVNAYEACPSATMWGNFRLWIDCNAGQGANDLVWIQWVRAFATEADAQAFFKETTPSLEMDALKSGMFFDMSTQDKYKMLTAQGALAVGKSSGATYDLEAGALKITHAKADGNGLNLQLGFNDVRTAAVAENTVVALKVKLSGNYKTSNATYPYGPYLHSANLYSGETAHVIFNGGTVKEHYNLNTTDWQLVLIDIPADTGASGTWNRILIYLDRLGGYLGTNASVNIWVQWAGLFANEQEATWYYNGEIPADSSVTNWDSIQVNAEKTAIRFGFDVATADYSGISYEAGSYDEARASGNYVRKLESPKMTIKGEKIDIVGFGALLTKATLNEDNMVADSSSVLKVEAKKLYDITDTALTYTIYVRGISNQSTTIYARSYVEYKIGEETMYAYGDIVSGSIN